MNEIIKEINFFLFIFSFIYYQLNVKYICAIQNKKCIALKRICFSGILVVWYTRYTLRVMYTLRRVYVCIYTNVHTFWRRRFRGGGWGERMHDHVTLIWLKRPAFSLKCHGIDFCSESHYNIRQHAGLLCHVFITSHHKIYACKIHSMGGENRNQLIHNKTALILCLWLNQIYSRFTNLIYVLVCFALFYQYFSENRKLRS